ncbi:hypothetical protein [Embleya sp. NBC_00896]|uniref:hypothetical protein n=1 Tax=Embleya sp. NBC_00896 TaxID=2975961 RepID=UPI002F9067C0|nr:hypothetical protein OG928_39195 [Embleya sp. NBC_00896]
MIDSRAAQRSQLVQDKLESAWGSAVGDFGHAPLAEAAKRAYQALYEPDKVVAGIESRYPASHTPKPLRDKTRATLEAPMAFDRKPDMESFVQTYVQAAIHEADIAGTMFPGAREQIRLAQVKGAGVGIYSAGEVFHQEVKLGQLGVITDETEGARDFPLPEPNLEFGPPLHVMSAIAEDKTSPENMARIRTQTRGRPSAVIDDREGKAEAYVENIPNSNAIVVGQGPRGSKTFAARGETSREHGHGTIHYVASIKDVDAKLAEIYGEQRGDVFTYFDVDDTLGDNTERLKRQLAAAHSAMERNGYLDPMVNTSPAVAGLGSLRQLNRSAELAGRMTGASRSDGQTNQVASTAIAQAAGPHGRAVATGPTKNLDEKARSLTV